MPLLGSPLLIKIDLKSEDFVEEWRDYMKSEWFQKQKKMGIDIDFDDFYNRESSGEIMDWEKEIIGDKDDILSSISKIIKNKDLIDEVSIKTDQYMDSLPKIADYTVTEHPREKERERRKKFREEERNKKFEKLLTEWKDKEKDREKEMEKEKEREIKRQKEKQKLLQTDLDYDPVAEKKKRKKDPDSYKNSLEARKRYLEKEREMDELEKKKEEEAKREEELRILKEEEERKKRKEWEENNAFTAMEVVEEPLTIVKPDIIKDSIVVTSTEVPIIQESQKFVDKEEHMEDLEAKQEEIILPVLNESTRDAADKIEQESRLKLEKEEAERMQAKRILENIEKDEEIKKQVNTVKQLYDKIPTKKSELFKYPINWEIINENAIIEKKLRPWVEKRIMDYLGSEEEAVINLIVKKVKKKCPPQEIEDKMETVLKNEAEDFVMKMWKILVFEQLKVTHGLIKPK